MKSIGALLVLTGLLVAACGPQVDLTQTAAVDVQEAAQTMTAQTQASGSEMPTADTGGTMSTAAPAISTEALAPSPTPSGQYEFFDVGVDQVSADEVDVSFGFQLEQDVQLGEVQLGAWPVGCDDLLFSLSLVPVIPFSYSGWVKGDDVVQLSLDGPGRCESEAIQLMVYRPDQPGNLYQQTFDIPFTLAKQ
ncbi:MAG: hypothetical protein ACK2T0_04405 [Anaerolineales bacterium]